ncbi:octopine dehydrogenase [Synergistales bacterium]|nr:octopine dehydrogenase [Synergistales bacterium]
MPAGFAKLSMITTDIASALRDAEIVIVAVPSYGEAHAAEVCAPYLKTEQHVYLSSGYMYGSLEFSQTLKKNGNYGRIAISEMNNTIYAAFKTDSITIWAGGYKHGLGVSAFPGKEALAMVEKFKILYPEVVHFENIVKTGISNPNPSLHTTTVVFNACYVERKAEVLLYHDGEHLSAMSEAVERVNEDMDAERMELVKRGVFDFLRPWKLTIRDWYGYQGVKGETLCEIISSHPGLSRGKLPKTFDHRYLTEDVTAGLLPLVEILERYDIACPTNKSVAHLASSLSGINLRTKGRTLHSLGLDKLSNKDLFRYLYDGDL